MCMALSHGNFLKYLNWYALRSHRRDYTCLDNDIRGILIQIILLWVYKKSKISFNIPAKIEFHMYGSTNSDEVCLMIQVLNYYHETEYGIEKYTIFFVHFTCDCCKSHFTFLFHTCWYMIYDFDGIFLPTFFLCLLEEYWTFWFIISVFRLEACNYFFLYFGVEVGTNVGSFTGCFYSQVGFRFGKYLCSGSLVNLFRFLFSSLVIASLVIDEAGLQVNVKADR